MNDKFDDIVGEAEEITLTETFGSFKVTDNPVIRDVGNLEDIYQDFIDKNINGFKIKINNDHPEAGLVFVWFNQLIVNIHEITFNGLRASSRYFEATYITPLIIKFEIGNYTKVNTIIENGKIVRPLTPMQREYTITTF